MAEGRPQRPKSMSRQREAHRHGATGRSLPPGLASMADTDPSIDAAHDAGRNGVDFDDFASGYYAPKEESPRSPRVSRTRPAPGSGGSRTVGGGSLRVSDVAGDASGLLLGAIAYALVLSLITMGTKGPATWFKAKFLNISPAQPKGLADAIVSGTPTTGAVLTTAPSPSAPTAGAAARSATSGAGVASGAALP